MRLKTLKVLSKSEVNRIHDASVRALAATGMLVFSRKVLELLEKGGAEVDYSAQKAKFPPGMVDSALKGLPAQVTLFDRDTKPAVVLGKRKCYSASGHNAIFLLDGENRRPATKEDVGRFALISDALRNIHVVGIEAMPQDVRAEATLLHAVEAAFNNTTKHIYFSPESNAVTSSILDMARAVAGKEDLLDCSPVTCQLSSTSPLFWETGAVEAVVTTAESGAPLCFLPQPFAGVTSPITLAALLTIHNAEVLSGIVISQLARKGCPVIYGSAWTTFDMKEANVIIGSPEAVLCRAAGAQLAAYYGIPYHTIGPDSDSHCHDEQNGWEKMMTIVSAFMGGADLIVNAGMFDTGLTVSFEQLVIDDEMLGWAYRFMEGIKVSPDTIAEHVIAGVGPRGNFLAEEHTLKYLGKKEHWEPSVSARSGYETWAQRGKLDIVSRASQKARQILSKHRVEGLPGEKQNKITGIISSFENALVS